MQRLEGRVAIVTGASRGGGRGIALALGAEGATVYVTGRSVRGGSTRPDLPGTTINDTVGLIYRAMGRKGLESIENVGPRMAEVVEGLIRDYSP